MAGNTGITVRHTITCFATAFGILLSPALANAATTKSTTPASTSIAETAPVEDAKAADPRKKEIAPKIATEPTVTRTYRRTVITRPIAQTNQPANTEDAEKAPVIAAAVKPKVEETKIVAEAKPKATDKKKAQSFTEITTPEAKPSLSNPAVKSAIIPKMATIQRSAPTPRVAAPLTIANETYAGDMLARMVAVYGTYHSDVTRYRRQLKSSAELDEALKTLGTHNTDAMARGWLAYSALIAAKSPVFAAEVKKTAAHYGKDRILLGMKNDKSYMRSLKGSGEALGLAIRAGDADARRLEAAGEQIKQQAYSLQSIGWAKARLPSKYRGAAEELRVGAEQGRPVSGSIRSLFEAPKVDAAIVRAGQSGSASLWDTVSYNGDINLPGSTHSGLRSRYGSSSIASGQQATANTISTLAAYRILGETMSSSADVSRAANNEKANQCFQMAHLQLRQCVTAAHKVYERPFCIGEHALKDIGKCVGQLG